MHVLKDLCTCAAAVARKSPIFIAERRGKRKPERNRRPPVVGNMRNMQLVLFQRTFRGLFFFCFVCCTDRYKRIRNKYEEEAVKKMFLSSWAHLRKVRDVSSIDAHLLWRREPIRFEPPVPPRGLRRRSGTPTQHTSATLRNSDIRVILVRNFL